MREEGNYYLIKHLQLFTGLTDRTIRSYIASGILQGEKIEGIWHFTPEQVDAFIYHPTVRPSIIARHNSLVYDHLLDTKKTKETACIILDIPEADPRELAEFFSYSINWKDYQEVQFFFDNMNGMSRVILSGEAERIFEIVDTYRNSFPK